MSSFHQVLIGGYPGGGLVTDKKPLMLPDEAFSTLQNAYVWRDRTKKREGTVGVGRLRRLFAGASLGTSRASPWTFNIYSTLTGESYFPITPEPNAEIAEGFVTIIIGTMNFVDQNGVLVQTGSITGATQANPCEITSVNHDLTTGFMVTINDVGGMVQLNGNTYTITVIDADHFILNGVDSTGYTAYTSGGIWTSINTSNFGTINYLTGAVTITYDIAPAAATITFGYYPGLPSMGICKQDVPSFGIDNTIFFDTKYAYQYVSGGFQELVPGETWTGSNTDFFWYANYQGVTPDLRYFFVTNNNITSPASTYDPIRYYFNGAWADLQPLVSATQTLWQALIVIPYYGRLLALNPWEGTSAATANNYYARCRFSALGNPIVAGAGSNPDAWRSDIFGEGGFLDAPTNEAIVGAGFFRNVLIVFFEYSTWQLRYVGEYGLPFIFERISSDFGSVSTFSSIVFDQGVMTVSDRGIIEASLGGVKRLDDQIPETVFSFAIQNGAPNFVHGIRDFEKEVVYWNYLDTSNADETQSFPNTVLLFNYRNNTWAQFRDSITCFGTAQFQFAVTWDSLTTTWESNASWDNVDDQQYVDYVTAGNQQGFIFIYENQDASTEVESVTMFSPTLAITAVTFGTPPTLVTFTIPNHNLQTEEIIYLTGALWTGTDPGINNFIYQVMIVDANNITLASWDGENYVGFSEASSAVYIGGGVISLLPKMNIVGKDFNPFQAAGKQFKLSYIDFQMDSNAATPAIPVVTIQLFVNSYIQMQANLLAGSNMELINGAQQYGIIKGVSLTNPCIINSPGHSLITGAMVYISGIVGTIQLNNIIYTITVVDANNFSLNGINAIGFTTYVSGGIWNTTISEGQTYTPGSQYAWYRFYSTQFGQYLRVAITYDDALMNQLSTHQTPIELNAMNFWFREGGRLIN